jgi:MFS family permease
MLLGLGAGLGMAPLLTMALRDVPPQDAGLGSGIVNTSLQLSAALGLAVLGTIATDRTKSVLHAGHVTLATTKVDGYQLAFMIAGICVLTGILIAAVVLRTPRHVDQPDPSGATK